MLIPTQIPEDDAGRTADTDSDTNADSDVDTDSDVIALGCRH